MGLRYETLYLRIETDWLELDLRSLISNRFAVQEIARAKRVGGKTKLRCDASLVGFLKVVVVVVIVVVIVVVAARPTVLERVIIDLLHLSPRSQVLLAVAFLRETHDRL